MDATGMLPPAGWALLGASTRGVSFRVSVGDASLIVRTSPSDFFVEQGWRLDDELEEPAAAPSGWNIHAAGTRLEVSRDGSPLHVFALDTKATPRQIVVGEPWLVLDDGGMMVTLPLAALLTNDTILFGGAPYARRVQ